MRNARGVGLIAFVMLMLMAVGCTLQGTGNVTLDPSLEDVVTPTQQEEDAATELPDVIVVTPLGGEEVDTPDVPTPEPIEAQEAEELTEQAPAPTEDAPAPTLEAAPADTAAPGEVVFVRDGQVWSVAMAGLGEEPLTTLPEDAVIRDLTVSPDGRYAGFTVNGSQVAVLDLFSGELVTVDDSPPDLISGLVWTPDSTALYYQKTTTEPENIPSAQAVGLWHVIYEVPVNPVMGAAPITAVPESTGSEVSLIAALGERRLLLTEYQLDVEGVSRLLLYDRELIPLPAEGFQAISVVDVSPDQPRVLFLDQSDWVAEGPDSPVPLYVADLVPDEGLVNATPIASEPTSEYRDALFGPDGVLIAALRADVPFNPEAGPNVVLLTPDAAGEYDAVVLNALDGFEYPSMDWYEGEGIVVQRVPVGGGPSEIWLYPLDGAPGIQLGTGEQPAVVTGALQG